MLKKIIIGLLIVGFVFLSVYGYLNKEEKEISAEEVGSWTCSFIVPVASPIEESSELMNFVFKEYQNNASRYLDSVVEHALGIVDALSQGQDGIPCDFSKCQAEVAEAEPGRVSNVAPDFTIEFDAYVWKGSLSARPAFCSPGECVGDPCSLSNIRAQKEELAKLKAAFVESYTRINDLFSTPIVPVDYFTRQEGENADSEEGPVTLITRQEAVKRIALWAYRELEFCSLSTRERELVKAGKLGDRKVLRCKDALEQGIYKRPKPWSEKCEEECKAGLTEECAACLKECKGSSFLANLNCKMYREEDHSKCGESQKCCGQFCKQGFSPECRECMCEGLTDIACTDLVCAGSGDNYMCCHQGTLER